MSKTRSRAGWMRRLVPATTLALVVAAIAVMPAEAAPAPARFLGPIVSHPETPTVTYGRDGGFSVPLPNGHDFWIFADSPRLQYTQGAWRLRGYIPGSTAAVTAYRVGRPPTGRLTEVDPRHRLATTNAEEPFMPNPKNLTMPNSNRKCDRANGNHSTTQVRWATGGVLLPDKTNILIPYVMVCVVSPYAYQAEGWGFTRFNWKTNRFSQAPYDVFRPKPGGIALGSGHFFGSPVISGNKITFYSFLCCQAGTSGVYTTTVSLSLAALRNPASYSPKLVQTLPGTFQLSVGKKAGPHTRYTMYVLTGTKGQYNIYTAAVPTGPWSKAASGALPRCNASAGPCHSIILHPELSPRSRLLVSFHLPGYGPAIPSKHPDPHPPVNHVVLATIPCNC